MEAGEIIPERARLEIERARKMSAQAIEEQRMQLMSQAQDAATIIKQQVMSERNKRLSIPKPVSVQPSVNVQSSKKSAENQMMDSMLTDYKKKNPFT